MLRRTLNLGILAHVDAGKTTLTERLLYAAGIIDELGSVDAGTTQTDSLELERKRGITIKSAVTSFAIDDVAVNLIDTPGHPDFIAEVERVLSVLDGAVLVVSAVEGVQAQTLLLMRALQRLEVPTLVFVNKIDRGGADDERVLQNIAERLTPAIVPMGFCHDLGARAAVFKPFGAADAAFRAALASVLTEHDEDLLAAYVADEAAVSYSRLRADLATQTKRALVHPVFCGSAITGAGVDSLMAGIAELLPADAGDVDGPVTGTVFKIERSPGGEKIAYVRMFSGTVRTRDRLQFGLEGERKVTAVSVFDGGTAGQRASVSAGEIGKLWGLAEVQIGDTIGTWQTAAALHHFDPPTLETIVVPIDRDEKGALRVALDRLAEQDPLINVRQDDIRQEMSVSLYGEVQKEVIEATLANDFGIGVEFRETTPICIERPVGTGAALEEMGKHNPFLATVGLRVEPAAIEAGVEFRLEVELVSIPLYVYKAVDEFRRAMEDTVQTTLREGLSGWQVAGSVVTMTQCGYAAPSTGARDFRLLTPLVLMSALKRAGTVVCEPIHRFRLEGPVDTLGTALGVLPRLGAVPQAPSTRDSTYMLEGDIPAARMHELQQQLRALTRGEGVLELAFDRYEPVSGTSPTRPRTDRNPLNREEYLLHLRGRM